MIFDPLWNLPPAELRTHSGTARKFSGNALCRMCGKPKHIRPLTRHHLIPVSWFRHHPSGAVKALASATANLIPLCRPCHDLVDNRRLSERAEARRHLRRSLTQQEIAFAIGVRGRGWLDIEYPTV